MSKEFDEFPGVVTSPSERELQRAYKLGVLHGINAQSMAQAKNDVMEFDDYGWEL